MVLQDARQHDFTREERGERTSIVEESWFELHRHASTRWLQARLYRSHLPSLRRKRYRLSQHY
jgi:hypothetical protein